MAAREGNGKCIEVLLENGADYTVVNDKRDTALKLATDQACREQLEHTIAKLEVPQRSRTEESIVQSKWLYTWHNFTALPQQFFQLNISLKKQSGFDRIANTVSTIIGLHECVESRESHQFFQLYNNQSKEKVDLSTRWYDRRVSSGPSIAEDSGTVWYSVPPEPGSTETLLYRWVK